MASPQRTDRVGSLRESTSVKTSFEGKGTAEINLISLTYSNKIDKIEEIFKREPNTDIINMKDIRLYTLLHIACLNNQISIAKKLFAFLKGQNKD
mmetsp:Transcript_7348/g.6693  ORF Transcript_7348/g.6693 Transcript_7348/m.6693 type:complete len:95 (-) Transcript_7348:428-712(-)